MTVRELVAALVRFGPDVLVAWDHDRGPAAIYKVVWDRRGTEYECALLTDYKDAEDD